MLKFMLFAALVLAIPAASQAKSLSYAAESAQNSKSQAAVLTPEQNAQTITVEEGVDKAADGTKKGVKKGKKAGKKGWNKAKKAGKAVKDAVKE